MSVDVTVTLSLCQSFGADLRALTGAGRGTGVKAATTAWRNLFLIDVPAGHTQMSWLRQLVFDGATERYGTRECFAHRVHREGNALEVRSRVRWDRSLVDEPAAAHHVQWSG